LGLNYNFQVAIAKNMTDNVNIQNKAEAAIQQINLGYNTQQDRLLLRVGLSDNSELLVWLTHRITKQLWQILNGETNLPTATSIQAEAAPQQAVEQFKQEAQAAETLKNLDFASEYQPRTEVVNNGAMLAISIVIIHFDNKPPSLEMPCLEGVTVRMNLTQELILALCNMLQLSSKEAAWSLGEISKQQKEMQAATVIAAPADEKKILH
jgi:hypothetical protein